jgi:hypothetical protein
MGLTLGAAISVLMVVEIVQLLPSANPRKGEKAAIAAIQ